MYLRDGDRKEWSVIVSSNVCINAQAFLYNRSVFGSERKKTQKTKTDRQTERNRQSHRQKQTERNRQSHRQTERWEERVRGKQYCNDSQG